MSMAAMSRPDRANMCEAGWSGTWVARPKESPGKLKYSKTSVSESGGISGCAQRVLNIIWFDPPSGTIGVVIREGRNILRASPRC